MKKYLALFLGFSMLLYAQTPMLSVTKTQKLYTIQLFSVKNLPRAKALVQKLPEPLAKDTTISRLGDFYVGEYGKAASGKSLGKTVSLIRKNYFHDAFVKSRSTKKKYSEMTPHSKESDNGYTLDRAKKIKLQIEADNAFKKGDISHAVTIYEFLASRAAPKNGKVLTNLFYLYGLQGNWTNAKRLMKKSHNLDALLYAYTLGALHGLRKNEIEHIIPFARLDRSGRLMLVLGLFFERDNRLQEAFRWYSAGYTINPADPYVAYAYARILDMRGHKKEAVRIYEHILRIPFAKKNLQKYAQLRLRQLGRVK
ncbi:tetratricopeptide repeat protein [Hydrogenimonas sp.]